MADLSLTQRVNGHLQRLEITFYYRMMVIRRHCLIPNKNEATAFGKVSDRRFRVGKDYCWYTEQTIVIHYREFIGALWYVLFRPFKIRRIIRKKY